MGHIGTHDLRAKLSSTLLRLQDFHTLVQSSVVAAKLEATSVGYVTLATKQRLVPWLATKQRDISGGLLKAGWQNLEALLYF